jgi:hypothetical protein
VVQFDQLGLVDCSLTDELALPLHGPTLDVGLSSTDSHLLLLLIGILLLRSEPGVWLQCERP